MRLRLILMLDIDTTPEQRSTVPTTGELLDEDGREEPSSVRLRAMPALAKCGERRERKVGNG